MIIPIPKDEPDELIFEHEQYEPENNERIKDYLNVAPWKCPDCRLTNFGRNKRCAACRRER